MKSLLIEKFPYYLILSILLVVTTVLVLAGCSGSKEEIDPSQIEKLQGFSSGDELQKFLNFKNEPKYTSSGGLNAAAGIDSQETTAANTSTPVEADIYQVDGNHLYQAVGNKIHIVNVASGVGAKAADLILNDDNGAAVQIREMYFYDNKLIVIAEALQVYYDYVYKLAGDGPQVKFFIIDVTNPAAPSISRKASVGGYFADSKRVGDYLYTVLRFYGAGDTADLPFVKQGVGLDVAESIANDRFLAPKVMIDQALTDGHYKNVTVQNRNATLLVTLPLKNAADLIQVDAVFGQNDFLHVSSDNIYLINTATIEMVQLGAPDGMVDAVFAPTRQTSIHQFSIVESPEHPRYVASGKVSGQLVNKFGADEYDGVLRLATQESAAGLNSNLIVLQRDNGQLKEVAAIRDLAKGEILSTSYFLGKRGFLVTYKLSDMQNLEPVPVPWDPLITLDLSDTLKPVVKGELVIPGYSSFLRDYNNDRLVSVGVSENWSVAASMFNIGDLAQPSMINRLDYTGSSEAQNEHRAFNLLAERNILTMPITGFTNGVNTNRLEVMGLDATTGLSQLATFNFDLALGNVRRAVDFQDQFVVLLDGGAAGYDFATMQPLWQLTY